MIKLKIRYLTLIILVLVIQSAGCKEPVEFPIQREEMAIPVGYYQLGGDMYNRHQARMTPISSKPEMNWISDRADLMIDPFNNILVDGEGGVWFKSSNALDLTGAGINEITSEVLGSFVYHPRIFRLDSVGDKFWDKDFNLDYDTDLDIPFLGFLMENAAIISISYIEDREERRESDEDEGEGEEETWRPYRCYLECVDYNGRTRWRTEPIENDQLHAGVWRTAYDRILMAGADYKLYVYSIFDGEHLDTIQTPGVMHCNSSGPLPIRGDCLVMYGVNPVSNEEYIGEMDFYGNSLSYRDFRRDTQTITPVCGDETFVYYGSPNGLVKVNIDSGNEGETIWHRYQGQYVEALGLTYFGNVVITVHDPGVGPTAVKLVSPEGGEAWSRDLDPSMGPVLAVIYEDNSILLSHAKGLLMLNGDGSTSWTLSPEDMDFPRGTVFTFLKPYPIPYDGLFLHYQRVLDNGSLDEGIARIQGDTSSGSAEQYLPRACGPRPSCP